MKRLLIPLLTATLLALTPHSLGQGAAGGESLPADLEATGFAAAAKSEFTPRHALWSDGQEKRRWIALPAGGAIDKSDADRWEFPRGTRAWKEFSRDGRRNETRFIERRADGSWRYATYAWSEDGTRATLAPEDGIPGRGIPSRADCVACHEGAAAPLLSFSAVQLETELPPALGYLHANCGHCHNDGALPALGLTLAQSAGDPAASAARTLRSLTAVASRIRLHGSAAADRPAILLARMKSRDPLTRMPPLGVDIVDAGGVALVERWLDALPRQEIPR